MKKSKNVKITRGQSMRVCVSALSTSLAVAICLGGWLVQVAQAESAEQEPIVKVNPYGAQDKNAARTEAEDVIDVLQVMGKAYATGDIAGYIKHLDNNCSVFDEEKNKMVQGKAAVITALTEKFARNAKSGADHILTYTIDQPYVKVNGQTAVVTYHVIEEVGGKHRRTLEGSMSDVFQKEDGHWMKVHQQAAWKRIK
ncbi:MAG: nuclear transport factor 2 family protein [Cyanobacteria bacterium SZAS-4]|nr:nuclear transport factor 2 family protein [Cyanobacteria bacterium SZAS-4]